MERKRKEWKKLEKTTSSGQQTRRKGVRTQVSKGKHVGINAERTTVDDDEREGVKCQDRASSTRSQEGMMKRACICQLMCMEVQLLKQATSVAYAKRKAESKTNRARNEDQSLPNSSVSELRCAGLGSVRSAGEVSVLGPS